MIHQSEDEVNMPNFIGLTSMSISVAVHRRTPPLHCPSLEGLFCAQWSQGSIALWAVPAVFRLFSLRCGGLYGCLRACVRVCVVCVTPAYTYMCVYTAYKIKEYSSLYAAPGIRLRC